VAIRDADGKSFDGGNTYRLTVPANAPAELYWSATVYDRLTVALIRDQSGPAAHRRRRAFRRIRTFARSIFRPKPSDGKETNWVPTQIGRD